jgi:hypothetical protein
VARMHDNGLSLDRIQKLLALKAFEDLRQFPQYEATFKDNAAAYFSQIEHRGNQRKGRKSE